MADLKISALPASTTPLAGTEVLPIVQSSATKQVSVADLTAGRAITMLSLTSTNDSTVNGVTIGRGLGSTATNTAIGASALSSNSGGINNTAVGYQAGKAVTDSSTVGVTFVGSQAGLKNTTGYNDGFGVGALKAVVTGNSNAAFGYGSLEKTTASGNSAFGFASLNSNVIGAGNTGFGASTLQANTGANNTAVGYRAGVLLTTGANNTLIGGYEGVAGLVGNVIISDGAGNQRIAIDSSGNTTIPAGNIIPGTAAKGINYTANTPAAGMTSQLLNWYEEGTWTPLLSDGTNNATTDVNTGGTYTRVGRMLHLTLYISTTSLGSVSGGLSVKGFPFACRNSQSSRASTVSGYSANILVTAGQAVGLLMSNNATTATVTLTGGATGSAVMTSTQWTATGQAFFQISYPI